MKFLIKIFSPLFFFISLTLLIYIFYKSEIYWDGKRYDYYYIYYIFSFILIVSSILSFYISFKIKEYLIIISFYSLLSLYTFEAYLIFKPNKDLALKKKIYEANNKEKYDERNKLEIYNDFNKNNQNFEITVKPTLYKNEEINIHSLSGISNVDTINCNENGKYSYYKSDRYGFNNPDNEWDSSHIEYFLLGDSFVHGACVNRNDDIASVLRILSKKSVLNLGYDNNGPLLEYATLREYFQNNVKKVLWFYYQGNDLINLPHELNIDLLKNYLYDNDFSQHLKNQQSKIDNLGKNQIKQRLKKKLNINFLKLTKIRTSIKSSSKPLPPSNEFKKILKLTKDLTNKNNVELFFIYLPTYARYVSTFDNKNYDLVNELVNSLEIKMIDIHKEVFEKEKNPLILFPFKLKGHYNEKGYKKIAESIYELTK